jgi:chromosome segregation and condensation protein ScpB
LRIRRLLANQTQPRNASAFLINRDEGLDVRDVAEVSDEFAELSRTLDVPAEKDEATGLELFETGGGFGVEFGTGDAHEKELTEEVGGGHNG